MTDKSADPDITTPVRDNEASSFSLSVTARGDFTYDSLGTDLFGQAGERTAKGHVTRLETTGSRSSSFAGVAGDVDGLPGGEPVKVPPSWGASSLRGYSAQ